MAEQREKSHHILLSSDGNNTTLELYTADQWPNCSSQPDEFRVRINGKWYCPAGKYTFLGYEAIGRLIGSLLSGVEPFEEEEPPKFQTRQRVSVSFGDCVMTVPVHTQGGYVAAPPFRGVDGRWRVPVTVYDGGTQPFLCHDVMPVGR
jgi:hypothetical protein